VRNIFVCLAQQNRVYNRNKDFQVTLCLCFKTSPRENVSYENEFDLHENESKPPKAFLQAINNLKRREDIIITKPDKGSGVVVMDKTDYLRLLCDASIRDSTKFI